MVPEEVWNLFIEWYGGGPAFPRKIVKSDSNILQIELYPPILYICLSDNNGSLIKDSIQTMVLSSKLTLYEVHKQIAEKFNKITKTTRLWYKLRKTSEWQLIPDYKKTVEEYELLDGDYFLLETCSEFSIFLSKVFDIKKLMKQKLNGQEII